MLKDDLKKENDEERREELKKTLDSLSSRIQSRKQNEYEQGKKAEWRKHESALVKDGKKPFFMKQCKSFARYYRLNLAHILHAE